jgi:hypothetical protein
MIVEPGVKTEFWVGYPYKGILIVSLQGVEDNYVITECYLFASRRRQDSKSNQPAAYRFKLVFMFSESIRKFTFNYVAKV